MSSMQPLELYFFNVFAAALVLCAIFAAISSTIISELIPALVAKHYLTKLGLPTILSKEALSIVGLTEEQLGTHRQALEFKETLCSQQTETKSAQLLRSCYQPLGQDQLLRCPISESQEQLLRIPQT